MDSRISRCANLVPEDKDIGADSIVKKTKKIP